MVGAFARADINVELQPLVSFTQTMRNPECWDSEIVMLFNLNTENENLDGVWKSI